MTVSFGKYIPVKVFVDGKEVKSNPGGRMPEQIERVTLTMCDCLIKDKNYPKSMLAEQQRRFFASKVSDYKPPTDSPKNKTDILPSSVKTANIDGQRYLVTGDDILTYKEQGHQLGIKRRDIVERAEDRIGSKAEFTSKQQYDRMIHDMTQVENRVVAQDRINLIKQDMRRNNRVTDETLCIHAITNPDYIENKSPKRDKYRIALIDFKA